MAKRVVQGRTRRASSSGRKSSASNSRSQSRTQSQRANPVVTTLRGWYARPYVRYAAGGVGLFALTRLALNMSDRMPQISSLFRDGIDAIEGRLRDLTSEDADTGLNSEGRSLDESRQ